MGQGTSFDPDILEDACNDLTRIDTIIKASTSLSNMGDASTIAGDIGGLDDENGGWGYGGGAGHGRRSVCFEIRERPAASRRTGARGDAGVDRHVAGS